MAIITQHNESCAYGVSCKEPPTNVCNTVSVFTLELTVGVWNWKCQMRRNYCVAPFCIVFPSSSQWCHKACSSFESFDEVHSLLVSFISSRSHTKVNASLSNHISNQQTLGGVIIRLWDSPCCWRSKPQQSLAENSLKEFVRPSLL